MVCAHTLHFISYMIILIFYLNATKEFTTDPSISLSIHIKLIHKLFEPIISTYYS